MKKKVLLCLLFCLLLILPALIFWGTGPAILLPFKTFLCVTALNLLQQYFSWHEITAALRRFHLPPEVIFILDTRGQGKLRHGCGVIESIHTGLKASADHGMELPVQVKLDVHLQRD